MTTSPDRIILDPAMLVGKPIIAGTRLSVEFILGLLAAGWNTADILDEYPGIGEDDVRACLTYAHDIVQGERVYPSAA